MEEVRLYCEPNKSVSLFESLAISFDRVCRIPITFLGLKKENEQYLYGKVLFKDGKAVLKFKTLGDVVNFGHEQLYNLILSQTKSDKKTEEIMYDVDKSLAKFVLKVKGSDFTLQDIKVEDLNLTPEVLRLLQQLKIKTLGEIQIGKKAIFDALEGKPYEAEFKQSINKAMSELGCAYEGQVSDLNKWIKTVTTMKRIRHIPPERQQYFPQIGKCIGYAQVVTINDLDWMKNTNADSVYDYSGLYDLMRVYFNNVDEACAVLGLQRHAFLSIREGRKLSRQSLEKFCQYFNVDASEIVKVKKFVATKKTRTDKDEPKYDYTRLLNKISEKYPYSKDFVAECDISATTLTRMLHGKKLSMVSLKEICRALGCEPDEVVDYLTEEKRPEGDCDYSALFDHIYKKLLMHKRDFCKEMGFTIKILRRMEKGEYIGAEKINRIAQRLRLDPSQIVKINNPNVIEYDLNNQTHATPFKMQPEIEQSRDYDYHNLMQKIQKEFGNFSDFCKTLSLSRDCAYKIRRGKPLFRPHLEKICRYFDCKPSDLMTAVKEGVIVDDFEDVQNAVCDYTRLKKYIDLHYRSIQDFITACGGLSERVSTDIVRNKPLTASRYRIILDKLNCKIEDIVEIKDEKIKAQVFHDLEQFEKKEQLRVIDYSKIMDIIERDYETYTQFIDLGIINRSTFAEIKNGRPIMKDKLQKLSEYFHIPVEEIAVPIKNPIGRKYIRTPIQERPVYIEEEGMKPAKLDLDKPFVLVRKPKYEKAALANARGESSFERDYRYYSDGTLYSKDEATKDLGLDEEIKK